MARKSEDVIVELEDDDVDDVVLVVAVETELVAETVIRNSGSSSRSAPLGADRALEICVLMKRGGGQFQARQLRA